MLKNKSIGTALALGLSALFTPLAAKAEEARPLAALEVIDPAGENTSPLMVEVEAYIDQGETMREATLKVLEENDRYFDLHDLTIPERAVLLENLVGLDDGDAEDPGTSDRVRTQIIRLYNQQFEMPDYMAWHKQKEIDLIERLKSDPRSIDARSRWGDDYFDETTMTVAEKESYFRYIMEVAYDVFSEDGFALEPPEITFDYRSLDRDTISGLYNMVTDTVTFNTTYSEPAGPDIGPEMTAFDDKLGTFLHEAVGHGMHKIIGSRFIEDLPERDGLRILGLLFETELDPHGATNMSVLDEETYHVYLNSPTEELAFKLGMVAYIVGAVDDQGNFYSEDAKRKYDLTVKANARDLKKFKDKINPPQKGAGATVKLSSMDTKR